VTIILEIPSKDLAVLMLAHIIAFQTDYITTALVRQTVTDQNPIAIFYGTFLIRQDTMGKEFPEVKLFPYKGLSYAIGVKPVRATRISQPNVLDE
jgi:hypothetical protein